MTIEGPINQERYPFEIKISSNSSINSIREKFFKGRLIQFVITKNLSIWLTDKGHDNVRFADGLRWEEIASRGYVRYNNSALDVKYYEDPDRETKDSVFSELSRALLSA